MKFIFVLAVLILLSSVNPAGAIPFMREVPLPSHYSDCNAFVVGAELKLQCPKGEPISVMTLDYRVRRPMSFRAKPGQAMYPQEAAVNQAARAIAHFKNFCSAPQFIKFCAEPRVLRTEISLGDLIRLLAERSGNVIVKKR